MDLLLGHAMVHDEVPIGANCSRSVVLCELMHRLVGKTLEKVHHCRWHTALEPRKSLVHVIPHSWGNAFPMAQSVVVIDKGKHVTHLES